MDMLNVVTEILALDEARRRLADARVHVERLMSIVGELSSVRASLQSRRKSPNGTDRKPGALRQRVDDLERDFRACIQALNLLGAVVKDPGTGLLDFHTWQGDELVYLCWRHGEDTIRHWHPLDGGFGSRQPLPS